MLTRTYILANTLNADGSPALATITAPEGAVVAFTVDGRRERFELTGTPFLGVFVAQPLDRYLS